MNSIIGNEERILNVINKDNMDQLIGAITPLTLACLKNKEHLVNYLLELGADPNMRDSTETPLNIVCKFNINLVEKLLKKGADPNIKGARLYPLATAIKHKNLEIAKMLLEYGGNINIDDIESNPLRMAVINDDLQTGKWIIKNGGKVLYNIADYVNDSQKSGEVISFLKSNGGTFEGINEEQTKKMVRLVNNIDIIEEIMLYGGKASEFLMKACQEKDVELLQTVLYHGAEVGRDVVFVCCQQNFVDGINIMKNHSSYPILTKETLIEAVKHEAKDIVKMCIDENVDINEKDEEGKGALYYALIRKNREIAQMLVDNGAQPVEEEVPMVEQVPGVPDITKMMSSILGGLGNLGGDGSSSSDQPNIMGMAEKMMSTMKESMPMNGNGKNPECVIC